VLGYFGKCVLVLRKGPPEEARRALDKVAFLMARGQSVLVFPEGGRTRVGRVDTTNFVYGVGRMLQETPGARVVCIFARGLGQRAYTNFPRRGETFFIRMKRANPATQFRGLRADRDLATQIVRQLGEMEQEYFENAILDR
jgi:1-acyl-sn-glycerol-3-phosphate acyltransferase